MANATVHIKPETHAKLKELAEQSGEPVPAVLEKAVEAYRRQVFLEGLAEDFAALRRDPKAWEPEQAERREWDVTLADGLEDD